ncbi:hypothetical protein EJ07DRAFT_154279 [Lizonia empirigonia]|nr:hypothetical protein EJ07DRAFT_154279 [Lizonia empirigonia]
MKRPSQLVRYLSGLFDPMYCECCDHNVTPAITEIEIEVKPPRKSLRKWLRALKRGKGREASQSLRTTEIKSSSERLLTKYLYLGRKRWNDVRRNKQALRAVHTISVVDERQHPNKCAVRQILDTIFADIVESDSTLDSHTDAATQCFLVHILSDMDPHDSFLSRFQRLPAHVVDLVIDNGLSFASTWLQTSLEKIKAECAAGKTRLQMPFCILETNYATASARAAAMQMHYPGEKVGIAALDIVALKRARLVVSAGHAFDFLRVSTENVAFGNRLLVWAEGGPNDGPAQALREAVLTVVEWKEINDEETMEDAGVAVQAALKDGTCKAGRHELAKSSSKKDSAVIEEVALDETSKTGRFYLRDLSNRRDSI